MGNATLKFSGMLIRRAPPPPPPPGSSLIPIKFPGTCQYYVYSAHMFKVHSILRAYDDGFGTVEVSIYAAFLDVNRHTLLCLLASEQSE